MLFCAQRANLLPDHGSPRDAPSAAAPRSPLAGAAASAAASLPPLGTQSTHGSGRMEPSLALPHPPTRSVGVSLGVQSASAAAAQAAAAQAAVSAAAAAAAAASAPNDVSASTAASEAAAAAAAAVAAVALLEAADIRATTGLAGPLDSVGRMATKPMTDVATANPCTATMQGGTPTAAASAAACTADRSMIAFKATVAEAVSSSSTAATAAEPSERAQTQGISSSSKSNSTADSGYHQRTTAESSDGQRCGIAELTGSLDSSSGGSSGHMSVVDSNSSGHDHLSSDAASNSNENDSNNDAASTHSGSNENGSSHTEHGRLGDSYSGETHSEHSGDGSATGTDRHCRGGGLGKRSRSASANRVESEAQAPEASEEEATGSYAHGRSEDAHGGVFGAVHPAHSMGCGCAVLMAAAEASARADASEAGQQSTEHQRGAAGGSTRGHACGQRERPAPFLSKLMQIMENDAHAGSILHWDSEHVVGSNAAALVIADPVNFAKKILPLYFKHNKLSSFIQQLYTYGFRRVACADQSVGVRSPTELPSHAISFHHPLFRADAPDLMLLIKRNTAGSAASSGTAASQVSAHSSRFLPVDGAGEAIMRDHAGGDSGEGWDRAVPSSMDIAASGRSVSIDSQGPFDACSPDDVGIDAGTGGVGTGHGHSAADEVAELLSELEKLELSIEGLKRMQSERQSMPPRGSHEHRSSDFSALALPPLLTHTILLRVSW